VTITARSVHGVLIRLTDERWDHIVTQHRELCALKDEVLASVERPDEVREGYRHELLAIRRLPNAKFLVVVYRQISVDDGFIVTAFATSRERSLQRRVQLWP
jgi:hypothetical protein